MPTYQIIQRVVSIEYSGGNVGHDWTFYVHTGGGLVRFNSTLRAREVDDRPRVIGAREVEGDMGSIVRELWWASATERDRGRPDRGAGLYTPVALLLDEGAELWRSLLVEVSELGGPPALARLRIQVQAEVRLAGAGPLPTLDVTQIAEPPSSDVMLPSRTVDEFPEQFSAEVDAVESTVTVIGRRVVEVVRGATPTDPRAAALAELLAVHTSLAPPIGFVPRAALYELRHPQGTEFWAGPNSSMGYRSQLAIVAAFARAMPPLGEGFQEEPSLIQRLLRFRNTRELGAAATSLATLVASLTEVTPEHVAVERAVYVRTTIPDQTSGTWTYLVFVDPDPFAGPESHVFMVVWTDAWTE